MTPLVPIALFGWIPLALVIFACIAPRRALIATMMLAWLFLPMATYRFAGFPDFNKYTSTGLGALLGVALFDSARLAGFRPRWFDLVAGLWIITPFLSSLSNGLGVYDGLAATFGQVTTWGIPYFLGRVYFPDPAAHRELALGVVLAGLIYVPLCLYEIRMSPQLHTMLYGFHQHQFIQSWRGSTWRPVVFMQHGLMVAAWMMSATLVAFTLRRSGTIRGMWKSVHLMALLVLAGTTVLCRSMGATIMLAGGWGILQAVGITRRPSLLLVLAFVAPIYMCARTVGGWSARELVSAAALVNPDRAASLDFRLMNEDVLITRALQHPLLGWGGWGANRIADEAGTEATTDGLLIIYFGMYGLVGLSAFLGFLLLPAVLCIRRVSRTGLPGPAAWPILGTTTVILLASIDSIPNAMATPLYGLFAGALGSFAAAALPRRRAVTAPFAARAAAPAGPYAPRAAVRELR